LLTTMQHHQIREWIDVLTARRAAKLLAREIGFAARETSELAIVASELGSNILKYGLHGSISLRAIPAVQDAQPGIALVARDFGPQFHDLALAVQDGCDDRGPLDPMLMLKRQGIGGGLGAVLRLTHSFKVNPLVVGKEILVERYLKQASFRGR
jgi:anti-sigma regulatory factor (Ser/Thr protein kinase)